jgi:hypothetical protein
MRVLLRLVAEYCSLYSDVTPEFTDNNPAGE